MTIYKYDHNMVLGDNITFVVTDDCNLKCRYCYEVDKKPITMSEDTILKAIDYFFTTYQNKYADVVFDFVGGEPFVCIDLINTATEYIKQKFVNQSKWKNYYLNFSTNGTCFGDDKVRDYISRNIDHLSVGLSLDGCKYIHDYNRSNSFDTVMKYFKYWRQNFKHGGVKATLNHEAIVYIYESIVFMTSTCLDKIFMNTIFEDVWEDGDPELYYSQLIKTADYILDNEIYKRVEISLFDPYLIMDKSMTSNHNWCGCGSSMLAVDYAGKLFPCLRFKTLSKQNPLIIGDINSGIDYKKMLPFYLCHNVRNTPDCETCEAKAGCPNCTAFCYDETGSIFDRVSYMCEMHKARVKANKYYWNKLMEKEHVSFEELIRNERLE